MTRARVAPGASTRSAAAACTKTTAEIDVVPPSSRQVSPRSTTDAGGLEVFGLDPTLLPKALAIRDWLLTEAAQLADSGQSLPGLAERLIALGIPIDRITTAIAPSPPRSRHRPQRRSWAIRCTRPGPRLKGRPKRPRSAPSDEQAACQNERRGHPRLVQSGTVGVRREALNQVSFR